MKLRRLFVRGFVGGLVYGFGFVLALEGWLIVFLLIQEWLT